MYIWPLAAIGAGVLLLIVASILLAQDYSYYVRQTLTKKSYFIWNFPIFLFSLSLIGLGIWLYFNIQGQL